jgi:hypothetical protein
MNTICNTQPTMKHYGHTITTSAAQINDIKTLHTQTDTEWEGACPDGDTVFVYGITIVDQVIEIHAASAEESYKAYEYLTDMVNAMDPFDMLWAELKKSIVIARTRSSTLTSKDNTSVQVKAGEIMMVRADALMKAKLTDAEAVCIAASLLANLAPAQINDHK